VRHPLESFTPICDAISRLFHPHIEVVLHDLATGKIFYIVNAFSKRRAGESSLNEPETTFHEKDELIGPYDKLNWDGRRLKSMTAVIRSSPRKPIGLLCINYDVSVIAAAAERLQHMITIPPRSASTEPLMAHDWRERANTVVGEFLLRRKATLAGLDSRDMGDLINELSQNGLFEIRRAVPYIAKVLGLSRATIYNHLAVVRKREVSSRRRRARNSPPPQDSRSTNVDEADA
jgi:predicted transcriptional regulator YheO